MQDTAMTRCPVVVSKGEGHACQRNQAKDNVHRTTVSHTGLSHNNTEAPHSPAQPNPRSDTFSRSLLGDTRAGSNCSIGEPAPCLTCACRWSASCCSRTLVLRSAVHSSWSSEMTCRSSNSVRAGRRCGDDGSKGAGAFVGACLRDRGVTRGLHGPWPCLTPSQCPPMFTSSGRTRWATGAGHTPAAKTGACHQSHPHDQGRHV